MENILLFADDIVIINVNDNGLHKRLNIFSNYYCK